ncbi:MAG: tetratricopeptide repeat protein [Thermodesulforhabdaceae bacterium]|jgi:tetratricopeptide (TPR) repeat protein
MADTLKDEEIEYLKVIAFVFLRYGKWEKASVIYELLREVIPEDPGVFKGLGLAYLETGKLPQALEYVDKWLERSNQEEERKVARMLKGRILRQMGKLEEARREMTSERGEGV